MVIQSNKSTGGGVRLDGEQEATVEALLASRWVRGVVQESTYYGPKDGIFFITKGSSMQAIIRSAPPHAGQVAMPMTNTSFNRCAQVIAAQRSADVSSSLSSATWGQKIAHRTGFIPTTVQPPFAPRFNQAITHERFQHIQPTGSFTSRP